MLKALRKELVLEPTPITDTLNESAKMLGIGADGGTLLGQAEIIRELTRRLVELEKR
jgi:hypothetical protein